MAGEEEGTTVSEKKKQDDPNIRLYEACRCNNLVEVRRLLEAGADVNAYVDPKSISSSMTLPRNTPLFAACWHSHYDTVRLLLDHGADVNMGCPGGWTPLHMCAAEGRIQTTEFLLSRGADVNARDPRGRTPLHAACENGCADTVKMLLEHGANAAIPNKYGKTAIHYVNGIKANREEILDLFRQYAPEQVMEAYCTPAPGGT